MHLRTGIDGVWCVDESPRIVVDENAPCDLEAVREALALWGPLGELPIERGVVPPEGEEERGSIYLSQRDVPGTAVGRTEWYRVRGVNEWARVRVERCDERSVMAHELGHAIGFADDYADESSVMYYEAAGGSEVPEQLFDAYSASRL